VDSGVSKEAYIIWGAHWRHLANIIEQFMCGGNAAFLSNNFDHLLLLWYGDSVGNSFEKNYSIFSLI